MEYLNKYRKYKTFFMLKYVNSPHLNLNNQNLDLEFSAYELSDALLEYGYEFPDLRIDTLRKKVRGEKIGSKLKVYCESMRIARHNIMVEVIALNTTATFSSSYNGFQTLLTTDRFKIMIPDEIIVDFLILPDGTMKLNKITRQYKVESRDYIFDTLEEFYYFLKNIQDNIDIDDAVLKMALI